MASEWNVYESFQALLQAGPYHLALEGVLVLCIFWLFTAKKKPSKALKLTAKEEEDLLADWDPLPLIPNPPSSDHPSLDPRTVRGKPGKYVDIGTGQPLLNLATHSYLGLEERPEIIEGAVTCLAQYGVGSCGPRGFYGTTGVHLELEKRLAKFFNGQTSILYSYAFSTSASAIPAYAKSGDIIFADEMVNFSLQRGLQASRSKIIYFDHNNPQHLRQLLDQQQKEDRKDPKRANATRKFLVLEGIYMNSGVLCDLPVFVSLRQEYKLRLFLDESVSFGTMGRDCRGVADHFNIELKEIDLLMASLEGSAGCTGGFCVGTDFVVEHQRLSGLGYCFSASLPPLLAAAAIKVVDVLEREGGDLVQSLQDTCKKIHSTLKNSLPDCIELVGDPISPVKHLRLSDPCDVSQAEAKLRDVVEKAQEHGLALTTSSYLQDQEKHCQKPSIRLAIRRDLDDRDVDAIVRGVCKAVEGALK